MHTRRLGILALVLAALTLLWVVLLALDAGTAKGTDTLDQTIATLNGGDTLFALSYINAACITLLATALVVGLSIYCWADNTLWVAVGMAFVPVYVMANLIVYLSQVFVVPHLLELQRHAESAAIARALLGLALQSRHGSAAEFLNLLGYAALAVPSIILAVLLYRRTSALHLGATLLAASGLLSFVGFIGGGLDSPLRIGAMVSGVAFLGATVLLGLALLRADRVTLLEAGLRPPDGIPPISARP